MRRSVNKETESIYLECFYNFYQRTDKLQLFILVSENISRNINTRRKNTTCMRIRVFQLKQRNVLMYFVMHSEITFCELNEWTGFFYRNVQKVSENVKPARSLVFWLSATALLFRFCIYYVNKCCMKFEYFSFATTLNLYYKNTLQ